MSPERQEKFFSGIVWLLIVFLLVSLAVAVSYFSDNNSSISSNTNSGNNVSAREPREYTVFYRAGVFGPTNIRIHVNDKVIFQNFDHNSIRIVSEGYPKKPELQDFDSKTDILPNGEYSFVFSKAGIFSYYNFNNPDEAGSVIVRP